MKRIYYIRIIIGAIIGILSFFAVCGVFYPLRFMDLQFTALLQRVLIDFSCLALVILISVIVITLLFGRFYCSIICPLGILQECASIIFKKKSKFQRNYPFKYFIAAAAFGSLIGGSVFFIRYLDPYTIFSSGVSLSIIGLVFISVILFIVFFKGRYFCSNICPVGAILGFFSKVSLNKIYIDKDKCVSCGMCVKSCPAGCINPKDKVVDNEICVRCLKCFCVCRTSAVKYGIENKMVSFSPKRREFILSLSALLVFSGAIKVGVEIGKRFEKKSSRFNFTGWC